MDSPDKNTEVGCHAVLQRIFLTQGLNPHHLLLLSWQVGSFTTGATGEAPLTSYMYCYLPLFLMPTSNSQTMFSFWEGFILRFSFDTFSASIIPKKEAHYIFLEEICE